MAGWLSRRDAPRDERGAVALETALVATVLFTIFAGIVDTASLFGESYSVAAAARSGARMASANPLSTTMANDAGIQVADALDSLDASRVESIRIYKAKTSDGTYLSGSCATNCFRISLLPTGQVSGVSGTWPARRACFSGADTVGVEVIYRNASLTGVFHRDRRIVQRAAMRLEPVPLSAPCVSS